MTEYMESGFKNSCQSTTDMALKQNKCKQKLGIFEWMTKKKTTLIQKDPYPTHQKDNPQQLYTDNMFTYDVENTDCTDNKSKINDLIECHRFFQEEQ